MNKLPKLLILGESDSGKSVFCEMLATNYGYAYVPASEFACYVYVFDKLKEELGYATAEECHADRRNHIKRWVDLIASYNTPDKAKLIKAVMAESDIYCGVRKRSEFNAGIEADLFDHVIYIDANIRKPTTSSFVELTSEDATFVVNNNGTLDQLLQAAKRLHSKLLNTAPTTRHIRLVEPPVLDTPVKAEPAVKQAKPKYVATTVKPSTTK